MIVKGYIVLFMKGEPIQVVEKLLIYASGQIFYLYFCLSRKFNRKNKTDVVCLKFSDGG